MARGRMHHHWDLFAPLICCVFNANVIKQKDRLTVEEIHPFLEKKVKPFSRAGWHKLKSLIKGDRQ